MLKSKLGCRCLWWASFIAVFVLGFALPASAKIGSYTFQVGGTADAGSKVRITAKAEDGTTYDQTFQVGGQTRTQIRDTIALDLTLAGWRINIPNGDPNGMNITGHTTPPPGNVFSPISQVDAGSTGDATLSATVDGNVTTSEAVPGDKKFKFICALPGADETNPGTVVISLNNITAEAVLSAGDTPTQAATKIAAALSNENLAVTLEGAEVILDWEDPSNEQLLGDEVHIDFGLEDAAGGPHVILELPDCDLCPLCGDGVCEGEDCESCPDDCGPCEAIPTVSEWGLIIMALLALTAGTIVFGRRRRPEVA